jgi:hypothetical protein
VRATELIQQSDVRASDECRSVTVYDGELRQCAHYGPHDVHELEGRRGGPGGPSVRFVIHQWHTEDSEGLR